MKIPICKRKKSIRAPTFTVADSQRMVSIEDFSRKSGEGEAGSIV